jgi:hypothetical protein
MRVSHHSSARWGFADRSPRWSASRVGVTDHDRHSTPDSILFWDRLISNNTRTSSKWRNRLMGGEWQALNPNPRTRHSIVAVLPGCIDKPESRVGVPPRTRVLGFVCFGATYSSPKVCVAGKHATSVTAGTKCVMWSTGCVKHMWSGAFPKLDMRALRTNCTNCICRVICFRLRRPQTQAHTHARCDTSLLVFPATHTF